jgi:ABC-2 type transport system ATP-binding protein
MLLCRFGTTVLIVLIYLSFPVLLLHEAIVDALTLNNVNKAYGTFTAVRDLSMKVPQGSLYGLLGPNGAGKTTTIRMIMDIIAPDSGSISVLDKPLDDLMKEKIGYLPEERGLYTKMKIGEMLGFFLALRRVPAGDRERRIDLWLEKFELSEWKQKKGEELSKGMQQKLQLACTLIHDPDLVILDEPFTGLDPLSTATVKDVMLQQKKSGKTIILSTHLMHQVERLCDHICLINKSEKVLEGNLAEIKAQYGKNTIVFHYAGNGESLKNHPKIKKLTDHGNELEIELVEGADPQEVIRAAVSELKVTRFQLVEPSVESIFIEKVKG